jgi:DNA repair protein RadC
VKLERLGEFRVLTLRECAPEAPVCDTPETAANYWRAHIVTDQRFNPEVETLVGLSLSTRRKVQGYYIVATGTLDTILAHPREVFRPAIVAAASAIVLMHNHPSGNPTPSEADIKVTRDMIRAGQLLKVELLDHVIMGTADATRTKDYCSLRELGYFYT